MTISPALAGQIVTAGISTGILLFGVSEIVAQLLENRARRKIESHAILRAKVEKFTSKHGERFEDRDDTVQERAS